MTTTTNATAATRPAIPREEYARRRDELRHDAREAGLDGLLVWSTGGGTLDRYANVFYLTNHYWPYTLLTDNPGEWRGWGQSFLVLPVEGEAVLVVEQPDWRDDLVDADDVVFNREVYGGVVAAMKRAGLDGG